MTNGGAPRFFGVAGRHFVRVPSMKRLPPKDETNAPELAEPRGTLLRAASEAIGARWVLDYSAAVQGSGRRIEGGWPGTLPEARGRVLASLPQELSQRGVAPLSSQELAAASAMASAEAKRRWRVATKRQSSRGKDTLSS
jgi:hypothetical protein